MVEWFELDGAKVRESVGFIGAPWGAATAQFAASFLERSTHGVQAYVVEHPCDDQRLAERLRLVPESLGAFQSLILIVCRADQPGWPPPWGCYEFRSTGVLPESEAAIEIAFREFVADWWDACTRRLAFKDVFTAGIELGEPPSAWPGDDPQHLQRVAQWEAMSDAERQAEVDRHAAARQADTITLHSGRMIGPAGGL